MPKKKHQKSTPDKKQSPLLAWLDKNILLLISGFLLAFIPLYPKLPLFEAIPGYIVRVRLEDMLLVLAGVIWFVQLLRKKILWKTSMTYLIIAYAVVGLLSTISAVLITQTVPAQPLHIAKTLLHYFRYLEYFSLFFITFSSIRTRADVVLLLKIIFATVIGIGVYAVGQKYLYWPVYSTMNREFSKGIRLYLTEHARVQSTFGGHYDLAAYLVIVTPLIMSFLFTTKKKLYSAVLWITFLFAVWMLIVSGSRASFFSFLVGSGLVILLIALKQTSVKDKISFFIGKSALFGIVLFTLITYFGSDLYDRLLQTMEAYPTINTAYHTVNKQRKEYIASILPNGAGSLMPNINIEKPENAISTEDAEIMVASDQQPEQERPSDVYVNIPDKVQVATLSADGTVSYIMVEKERTYSDTAFKHGLSLAIRLDTLWPRALAGFYRNPLLGSGYATLTKETTGQFTEAESTDNNYLRTLGETGLLGFITFYGAVLLAMVISFKLYLKHPDKLSQNLGVGFFAAAIGLLINASYIDVFASSKVAFVFWGVTGILFAYKYILDTEQPTKVTRK